jgi:hypothetical protein
MFRGETMQTLRKCFVAKRRSPGNYYARWLTGRMRIDNLYG